MNFLQVFQNMPWPYCPAHLKQIYNRFVILNTTKGCRIYKKGGLGLKEQSRYIKLYEQLFYNDLLMNFMT